MTKTTKNVRQTWAGPSPHGGWQVKKDGAVKAIKRTETQREAIKLARELARSEGGELVIQAVDGKIREKNTAKTA